MTPENWKTVSIAEISSFIGSGITPRGGKRTYQSSGVPLIRSQNVHFGGLRLDDVAFISDEIDASMARTRLDPGDVLLNITGASIGRCTYVPEGFRSGNVNQHVCIIRCNPEVAFYKYINCFLESNLGQNQIQSLQAGLSREALNFEQVRVIKIPLPLLNEQKKIAEILGSVDDAIAATHAAINQTRKVKQGLLQQLLTRGIGHTKFKETAIGLIPESWKVVKVDELKATSQYSCVGGPFGSDLTSKDYRKLPGVPVIRGNNLSDNLSRFKEEGFVFVSEEKAKHLYRNLAYPGDLIFTQRGTLGQIGLIPDDSVYKIYLISQSQMKLTPNLEVVSSSFLYHYFLSPQGLQLIEDSTIATGVPHINLGILKGFSVPVPPIPEQSQIVDILNEVDLVIIKHYEQLKQLNQLKTGLMQDLLTGRVRAIAC